MIAGTRMSVEAILEQLASGDTIDEVLESYPFLSRDDVYAALAYAAHLVGVSPASAPEPAAP